MSEVFYPFTRELLRYVRKPRVGRRGSLERSIDTMGKIAFPVLIPGIAVAETFAAPLYGIIALAK